MIFVTNDATAAFTEDVKGEKDAGKEAKPAREETAKGNGRPPAERPRFMFNIADGGFTGESRPGVVHLALGHLLAG